MEKIKEKIFTTQVLITGRYHAVCIAIAFQTPFLATPSNTKKIQNLVNFIGLSNRRIIKDYIHIDDDLVAAAGYSEAELEKIENFEQYCVGQADKLFLAISGLIKK